MLAEASEEHLGLLFDAIDKFFNRPTDNEFSSVLLEIIKTSIPYVPERLYTTSVEFYINIFTEELMLADSDFREKVRGLTDGGNVTGSNITIGHGNVINLPKPDVIQSLHQLPPPPADFTGRKELLSLLHSDFEIEKGVTITGASKEISGLTGMGGKRISKPHINLFCTEEKPCCSLITRALRTRSRPCARQRRVPCWSLRVGHLAYQAYNHAVWT